jgi:hypothetical protein
MLLLSRSHRDERVERGVPSSHDARCLFTVTLISAGHASLRQTPKSPARRPRDPDSRFWPNRESGAFKHDGQWRSGSGLGPCQARPCLLLALLGRRLGPLRSLSHHGFAPKGKPTRASEATSADLASLRTLGGTGPGRPPLRLRLRALRAAVTQVRSGQVRSGPSQVYYSAEVQDHKSHKAAYATSKVSSYLNVATLEYSKCYSRANHKHRRGPRRMCRKQMT